MLQHQRSWHPICKTTNVCLLYPLFSVSILTINKELSLRRRLKLQVIIKALFWLGNELSYHCLDYQLEILYVPILKINIQLQKTTILTSLTSKFTCFWIWRVLHVFHPELIDISVIYSDIWHFDVSLNHWDIFRIHWHFSDLERHLKFECLPKSLRYF